MKPPYEPRRPVRRRSHPQNKQRRIRGRLAAYRAQRAGRGPRRLPKLAVPSFFTLMNLFCGFLALVQATQDNFEYACWLIIIAGFFDVLDGMMARLANAQSEFGVQLDSLADVVSFGVAPAYLVYVFGLDAFGLLGLVVAALPALCGAVRLARFNVTFEGDKKDYFSGLPIPMQAAAVVALILNFNDASTFLWISLNKLSWLIPAVAMLSILMVSTIRFDAAPKPSVHYIRAHPYKATAYLIGVILVLTLQHVGLLVALIGYLAAGIGSALYRTGQVLFAPDAPNADGRTS